MPNNLDPKIIIGGVLIFVVVLLAVFSEFLLPLAIVLIPIAIVFGVTQLKKKT